MLILLLLYTFSSIFFIILLSYNSIEKLKIFSFINSLIIFFLSCILWLRFDYNFIGYQEQYNLKISLLNFNLNYHVGIDGISLFYIILTVFLLPICILISKNSIKYRVKEFLIILFVIQFLLINVFIILDVFYFYILFESILIPMFLLIGIWGSREEKVIAAYQFLFYTIIGSILMLISILIIYLHLGSTNYELLVNNTFSKYRQLFLWLSFAIAFSVKTPIFPFHIWLPKAHVEAPTVGSVLLAGILLKMGTYAFIRYLIPFFPYANKYYLPFLFLLCILSIIYTSITTIRQIDLKRIIAYSSIAHMSFVVIGLFTNNIQAIEGSMLLSISHAYIASALFILIGFLYDRYHTRIIRYYKHLIVIMPIYGIFLFLFILSNISFPGSSSFIAEFLIMTGTLKLNSFIVFIMGFGLFFGAVYNIWLYNRLMFSYSLKPFIKKYCDLTLIEIYPLLILFILVLSMGIFPNIYCDVMHLSIYNIII